MMNNLKKNQNIIIFIIIRLKQGGRMDMDDQFLQSLSASELDQDKNPPEKSQVKFYNRGQKSFDLYDCLINTYFTSEMNGREDICGEAPEIDVLQYHPPVVKKKRGRPKKSQKVEDSYSADYDHEEQGDIDVTLNKKKKKKGRREVKGDTKNIFPFFHRLLSVYLSKHIDEEQSQQIRAMQSNRHTMLSLLRSQKYRKHLGEMFASRHLNREVMHSRLTAEKKMVYLKKIQIFKDIFYAQENGKQEEKQRDGI